LSSSNRLDGISTSVPNFFPLIETSPIAKKGQSKTQLSCAGSFGEKKGFEWEEVLSEK